jgi:outer membrane protein assembly factor BamB
VFTLGATGILNVLDERDGSVIWTRDAAADNTVKVLDWGFTGSPVVVNNVVIVSLSGKLAGYGLADGKPIWSGTDGGNSYSSPHLITMGGIPQVVLMSSKGAESVVAESGKQLWHYDWPTDARILQPAIVADGDLLFAGEMKGLSRVSISVNNEDWTTKELWNSAAMKLNFNDFIIHKGYAYGFDGPAITCIDLKDGKRIWRGAPYRGFSILLAEQDLLLVLAENGDLALVEAKPDKFRELARIKVLKDKIWNVPALAGNILMVRNSKEMVALRLPGTTD